MKKRALRKDTYREIKSSAGRFISIMLIISLGAGFFVGIKATAPSVFATAETYFRAQDMMDMEILSTAGFSDEDIEAIAAIEGVEKVMPSYSVDLVLETEDEGGAVHVMSLPSDSKYDSLNNPVLLEGRWPENSGECVTIASDLLGNVYKIGDTVTFSEMAGTTKTSDVLTDRIYTVVGNIESPMYFSTYFGPTSIGNGILLSYAFIPQSNFLYSRYTEAFLTLSYDRQKISIFDDEYDDLIKDVSDKIKEIAAGRYEIFINELHKKIQDAEKELEESSVEANEQLTQAKAELEDAKKQIEDGKSELADGWAEYNIKAADAEKQLADAQIQIDDAKKEVADGERTLAESEKKYNEAVLQVEKEFAGPKSELDSARTELEKARKKLDEARAKYNEGYREYQAGQDEFNLKKADYDNGVKKLEEGIKKYDEGLLKYNDNLALYKKGQVDYDAGVKEYEQGLNDFKKGKKTLDEGIVEYNKNYSEYAAGLEKYENGLKKYEESYAEFEKGFTEYWAKSAELAEATNKYNDGLNKYNQGITDYNNGVAKLQTGKQQIAAGKVQLAENKQQYADGLAQYEAGLAQYNSNPVYQTPANKAKLDDAKAQLDAAAAQIADAEAQIAAGEKEIAQNEVLLANSKKELDAAKIELDAAKAQLEDGKKQLAEGKKKIDAGQKEIDAAKKELDDAKKILDDGKAELDKAKQKIDEGQTEIAEAESQLNAVKIQLDESKIQLDDGKIELEKGKTELDEAKIEIDKNKKLLADAKIAVEDGEKQLAEAKMKLDEAKAELDGYEAEYNEGKTRFDEGEAEYNAQREAAERQLSDALSQIRQGREKIEAAKKKIVESEAEMKSGRAELDDAKKQLEEASVELADAEKEYQAGLTKYEDGLIEAETAISDGRKRIQSGRNDLSNIENGKWYILDREDIVVYYKNLDDDVKSIDALAAVFPVFFLMLAALVCLSTMSRMIDEQRTQIGTYKALGYSSISIASKYIIYALTAGSTGSILGQALGVLFLPRAIFSAYKEMYEFPVFITRMPWMMGFLAFAVSLLCTVAVAWFSCSRELRTVTAALMRPKAPKAGKKILLERVKPFWNLFSFSQKITARNIFRAKVKMLMTIIGVTGCMSLVVTGFGMQDAITSIQGKQYGEIDQYDIAVSYSAEYSKEQAEEIISEFENDNRVENPVFNRIFIANVKGMETDKTVSDVNIIVPQNERIQKMVNLRDPATGEILTLDDSGVIITQKLSELFKLSVGDTFIIIFDNAEYPVTVSGIAEYYVLHNIYMTPAFYGEMFGTEVKYNTVYAAKTEMLTDEDGFKTDLLNKNEDILFIQMTEMISGVFDDVINNMNAVVFIMILSAGALAFIVVFNLTNINISERVREIATIKVLGFTHREVNMYIFKENFILGVAGIIFGIAGGYTMTKYIISTIEIEMLLFGRKTELSSYVYAAVLTLLFTVLVNIFMSKRMKNISMVESLKAIE